MPLEARISRKDFIILLCATIVIFLFGRLMDRGSVRKGYSATSDTTELQSLIEKASDTLDEIVLTRDYNIEDTIHLRSNITLRGSLPNAGTHITANKKAAGKYMFSGNSVENVKLINITFDLNFAGQQVDFHGREGSPVTNIIVEDCVFKQLGRLCRGLAVDYHYPRSATTTDYNRNIIVKNCVFDGAGAKGKRHGSLELAIFSNCRFLNITQCTFQNVPAEKDAGLAIYGYCRDVEIKANRFLSNVSDMYIQQATSVIVENNYFGSQVRIKDSRLVSLRNNGVRNLQIIDFDSEAFDTHPSLYRGSKEIIISNNRINTKANSWDQKKRGKAKPIDAIEIMLHNNIANMPKDIEISSNQVTCSAAFVNMKGMRSDSKDYIDNLKIWNNSVIKTSAVATRGIIELHINSNVPNQGLNSCSIIGNSVAESQLPWDLLVTPSGVKNL